MNRIQNFSDFEGNIVYTAIFGGIRDKLRSRPWQFGDVGFYSFLDEERMEKYRQFNITGWRLGQPQFRNENVSRQARAHKILAHKIFTHCRYSLWIDGCLKLLNRNVNKIMEKHLRNSDICVFKHRRRNCIYDEVIACIEQKKDDKDIMMKQVEQYRREGYPPKHGLGETTAVLRRHNKATTEFNEMWWEEIQKGSFRDQLSFDYVAWKLGIHYEVFPGNSMRNPYFRWFKHHY